ACKASATLLPPSFVRNVRQVVSKPCVRSVTGNPGSRSPIFPARSPSASHSFTVSTANSERFRSRSTMGRCPPCPQADTLPHRLVATDLQWLLRKRFELLEEVRPFCRSRLGCSVGRLLAHADERPEQSVR